MRPVLADTSHTRGITGSGKSFSIHALSPHLESFSNAKTITNPNASRHGRCLQLFFNNRGRIAVAKILIYGLDKSHLNCLFHKERTYHVFYQLLAGATPQERDFWGLEDISDYTLLTSSLIEQGQERNLLVWRWWKWRRLARRGAAGVGHESSGKSWRVRREVAGWHEGWAVSTSECWVDATKYWLARSVTTPSPMGTFELHFGFLEANAKDVSAFIAKIPVLEHTARLLGVPAEDLTQSSTNKTSYVRKEHI